MTPREAFKIGFLMQCADEGLSGEQTAGRISQLADRLEKAAGLGDVLDTAKSGLVTSLAIPVAAGAGIGYLAHRAAVPEVDEDDVKKRELIDEFRHYARRARDKQKVRSLRLAMP